MSARVITRKKLVSLGFRNLAVPALIQNSRHYVESMTGNPYFPAPVPPLGDITLQAEELEKAYQASLTRERGKVDVMRDEENKLRVLLKPLANYVERIANDDNPPGTDVIQKAGMMERRIPSLKPKYFTVLNGKISGEVIIDAKAYRSSVYIYEMTTDPRDSSSWRTLYFGTKVKYIQTGLNSGTRYYFRMALSRGGVQGDWSEVVDIFVF
jgi:hypothetical protein